MPQTNSQQQEAGFTIAEVERCKFVFQSHARAVVHIEDLDADEVRAFAALAELAPTGDSNQGKATSPRLQLIEECAVRFRELWRGYLDRRKATTDDEPTTPSPIAAREQGSGEPAGSTAASDQPAASDEGDQ